MIIREFVKYPDMVEQLFTGFDYFNDFKDTVNFLRGEKTSEADAIIKRLEEGHAVWLKHFLNRSKK